MSGSSGVCRRMDGTLLAEVSFDVVVMHHGHAADGMGRGCRGAEATRQCSTMTSQHPLARLRASLRSLRRGRPLEHDLYRETQRRLDGAGRGRGGSFWGCLLGRHNGDLFEASTGWANTAMELKPVRASEVGRVETRREGLSPDTHHKRSSCSPGRASRECGGADSLLRNHAVTKHAGSKMAATSIKIVKKRTKPFVRLPPRRAPSWLVRGSADPLSACNASSDDPPSRSATSRTVTTASRRHGASPRVSTTASVAASRASSRCPRSVTAATRRPATSSRADTRSSWSTTSVTSSRSS